MAHAGASLVRVSAAVCSESRSVRATIGEFAKPEPDVVAASRLVATAAKRRTTPHGIAEPVSTAHDSRTNRRGSERIILRGLRVPRNVEAILAPLKEMPCMSNRPKGFGLLRSHGTDRLAPDFSRNQPCLSRSAGCHRTNTVQSSPRGRHIPIPPLSAGDSRWPPVAASRRLWHRAVAGSQFSAD